MEAGRERASKPLGRKSYGSIGHLPQSRLGPSDHHVHEGQARICLEQTRDRHDIIIVQEKLDGSCCAVAKVDGQIHALGRAGYPATTSPFEQHHLFAIWVRERLSLFNGLLNEGERLVGEWMALAHGTIYDTAHGGFSPFVVFDLMRETKRVTVAELAWRTSQAGLQRPYVIHEGGALSLDAMKAALEPSQHGADVVEGAVYRVERKGAVDFLAKWVRPDKVDGQYLPEKNNDEPHWHWRPSAVGALPAPEEVTYPLLRYHLLC